MVLDVVTKRSIRSLLPVLGPAGRYVMVGAPPGRVLSPVPRMAWLFALSKLDRRCTGFFLSRSTKDDLLVLKELIEAGKVRPVIDRTYPFEQAIDAFRYVQGWQARAKVVITV